MASTNTLLSGIVVTFLLVIMTGIVLTGFNDKMGTDHSLGLDTSGLDDISGALGSAHNQTVEGEVTQADDGLSLKSSWAISKGLFKVLWGFVSGSWINNVIGLLNLGEAGQYVALIFRILFSIESTFASTIV